MTSLEAETRSKIIACISLLKKDLKQISRNSMFLAISILDKYLLSSHHCLTKEDAEVVDANVYAVSCYLLAWKFEGDQYPQVSVLAKTLAI